MAKTEYDKQEQPIRLKKQKKESERNPSLNYRNRGSFLRTVRGHLAKKKTLKNFSRGPMAYAAKGMHVKDIKADARQVIIKGRIVAKPKLFTSKSVKQIVADHLQYLQREGVSIDGKEPELFSSTDQCVSLEDFSKKLAEDRHHFRLIISPEDGHRLPLKEYTQGLVSQMETDLGTKLEWVAVAHHNTDNPHVHLVLRGVDQNNKDLIIKPNYFAHGIRNRARELATLELGPRHEQEIQNSLIKSLQQDRVIAIDGKIKAVLKNKQFCVPELLGTYLNSELVLMQKRINHLQSLGLAKAVNHKEGIYELKANFTEDLRNLEAQNDIYKRIARFGLTEAKQYIPGESGPLIGKIIDKGLTNELMDKHYIIVDGVDGNKWYADLSATTNSHDLNVGNWVKFEGQVPEANPQTEPNKSSIKINKLAENSLQKNVTNLKPTWADRIVLYPQSKGEVLSFGLGSELNKALAKRQQTLTEQGLGFVEKDQFKPARGLISKLEQLEIKQAMVQLSKQHRVQFNKLASQVKILDATLVDTIELSSGKYGVIGVGSSHVFVKLFKQNMQGVVKGDKVRMELCPCPDQARSLVPVVKLFGKTKELELGRI